MNPQTQAEPLKLKDFMPTPSELQLAGRSIYRSIYEKKYNDALSQLREKNMQNVPLT
jgi:hypothetical protein